MEPEGVRLLAPAEVDAAAALLARAFVEDPSNTFALRETRNREVALRWLYDRLIRAAWLRQGRVETIGLRAVALWLPVEGVFRENVLDLLRVGLWALPLHAGLGATRRFARLGEVTGRLHDEWAPSRHWYLQLLGVEPSEQGRGLGSALLKHRLRDADATDWGAYLETNNPKNLALYQRHGFRLVAHTEALEGAPLWAMARPQPSTAR